ncbi:DUF1643 domain-containing protein [Paenibacillus sp. GCM10012306]|uniref:DUF1643 domain-containing protein n=1 Tax=Paenibacillus sp. GCM10012306 TaxID=3317342 RepID=UPI0036103ABC
MRRYPIFINKVKIENMGKYKLQNGIRVRHNLVLSLSEKTNGEVLSFILMNPSLADTLQSDDTVNSMLIFVDRLIKEDARFEKVHEVVVLNLFPFYEPSSKSLGEVIKKVNGIAQLLNTNQRHIRKQLKKSHYVVLGWGNVPPKISAVIHKDETKKILEGIKKLRHIKGVFSMESRKKTGLTKKGQPRHPKYLAKQDLKLIKFL